MSECKASLYRSARGFIPAHALASLPPDTPLLIALSGGADSSLLLALCASYAKEHPHEIYAAHVNHCIRGKDADADEQFCRDMCARLGVRFFSLRADVPALANESGESIEGAARRVRYEFFAQIMREKNIKILATAHNADDNLETQIFNLARGAGLLGLSGIPRVRECEGGTLVRPMLDIPKREILSLCEKHGIGFVTDKTNGDVDYSRNRIRANVIPELEKLTSSPQTAALRCADSLREDEKYLTFLAEQLLSRHSSGRGVSINELRDAPTPIKYRVIRTLASKAGIGSSLEGVHYDAIFSLVEKGEPHSRIDLPQGFCATVERSSLIICKQKDVSVDPLAFEYELIEGVIKNDDGRFLLLIERPDAKNSPENTDKFKNIYNLYTEFYINFATIKGRLFFRTKKDGDVILQGGMHKKLKKLFGERSVSPPLRASIPILCDDDGIVWTPFCASRDGAAAKKSEYDLKISLFINDSF